MDANLQIDYWRESAAHDMEAAQTLFKNQKYDWCLFVGHLVIEKVLKAIYVRDKKAPPWIHNLVRLAENTTLQLSEEQLMFLANVNDFNIESRYPDYKFSFYKTCTKEFTEEQFTRIQEMYQCYCHR